MDSCEGARMLSNYVKKSMGSIYGNVSIIQQSGNARLGISCSPKVGS